MNKEQKELREQGEKLNNIILIRDEAALQKLLSSSVEQFLSSKPEDNLLVANENGETLLHLAADYNNDVLFRLLLTKLKDKKQALLAQDADGNTPLHRACANGSLEIVKTIFDSLKGRATQPWISPDQLDPKEALKFVNQLFKARNHRRETSFTRALDSCEASAVLVLEELLYNGEFLDHNVISDMKLKYLSDIPFDRLAPSLPITTTRGWQGVMKYVQPHALHAPRDTHNQKEFAVMASRLGFILEVLERSHEDNIQLERTFVPIFAEPDLLNRRLNGMMSALGKGLNARFAFDKGRTALHRSVIHKTYHITKMLLEKGADFGIMDDEGNTPLRLAKESPCPLTKGLFLLDQAKRLHLRVINNFNKYRSLEETAKSLEMKELSEFANYMNSFVQSIKEEDIKNENVAGVLLEMGIFLSEPSEAQEHIKNRKDLPKDFSFSVPINPNLAYKILDRIPQCSKIYPKAAGLKYRISLNKEFEFNFDSNFDFEIEEELSLEERKEGNESIKQSEKRLQDLISSDLTDEPLGNLALSYVIDDEHGMKGISGFKSFKEPDSCMLFLQYMRTYSQGMKEQVKKQEQENAALRAEIERLKALDKGGAAPARPGM